MKHKKLPEKETVNNVLKPKRETKKSFLQVKN